MIGSTLTFSLRGSREFPSAGRLTRNWTLKIRRSFVLSDRMPKSERSKARIVLLRAAITVKPVPNCGGIVKFRL